jgi:MFS family permease
VKPSSAPRDYALAWMATLVFFAAFYALLVPVPLYLTQIGLPDWEIAMVLGAFGVASLVSRPLAGAFADAWQRQQVMLLGAASLLAGAIGVGMTTSPILLMAMRILQATGYVCFTTAANALASDLAPPEERGAALARFGVSHNIAITVTPAAISAGLAVLTIRGALWAAGGLAAASAVLSFCVRHTRPTEPLPRISYRTLFRVPPALRIPMATAGVFGVGYGAFLQFLPLLAERRGLGHAGIAYTVYGIGIILTRLVAGRFLDRGDRTQVLTPAFFLLAAGLTGFALTHSRLFLYASAVLIAVGSGILHPGLIAIHVESMTPSERGRATAGFFLGFDLGVGMGAWVLSPAFQWFGLRGLYLLAAAAVCAGILLVQPLSARVRHRVRAISTQPTRHPLR